MPHRFRFARCLQVFLLLAGSMCLLSAELRASDLPPCYRQTTKHGFLSLNIIHGKVAAFSELLKGTTVSEDEVENAGRQAFEINVLLGGLVGDPARDYKCAYCDPAGIAPNALDNKGYAWSAIGLAERLRDSAERMAKQHVYNANVEQIADFASKGLAELKSRKLLPFCKSSESKNNSDAGPETGTPVCYKGSYVHTGGPRQGKVHKSSICIDWTAPCKLTGKGIIGQTTDSCTPRKALRVRVDMQSGVSLVYDLQLSKGKLRGTWEQSDGATGEWR